MNNLSRTKPVSFQLWPTAVIISFVIGLCPALTCAAPAGNHGDADITGRYMVCWVDGGYLSDDQIRALGLTVLAQPHPYAIVSKIFVTNDSDEAMSAQWKLYLNSHPPMPLGDLPQATVCEGHKTFADADDQHYEFWARTPGELAWPSTKTGLRIVPARKYPKYWYCYINVAGIPEMSGKTAISPIFDVPSRVSTDDVEKRFYDWMLGQHPDWSPRPEFGFARGVAVRCDHFVTAQDAEANYPSGSGMLPVSFDYNQPVGNR